jgi:perosamine synthetase
VAVNSGTCGLHLAVRTLGLARGDEVVTTPFSFIASSNCLLFEDVTPVFVDVDPWTLVMDMDQARSAVNLQTRALLPVHVFGNAVDMDAVESVRAAHGLHVIEDACEAVGGKRQGQRLGSQGDFGVFGFYPNKQMTTGEGGVVVCSDPDHAVRLRSLRNQGRSPSGDGSFAELGFNYRMSEITAAIGVMQVRKLDAMLERRRQVERRYCELLGDIEEIQFPIAAADPEAGDVRSPFVFIVQCSEPGLRDALRAHLLAQGIQNAVYFRPIHLESFYRERFGFRQGQFPHTERAGQTCLAIPFYNALGQSDQDLVAGCVREGVAKWLRQGAVSAV